MEYLFVSTQRCFYIDMLIYLVQVKPTSSNYVLSNIIKKKILFCLVRSSSTILICKSYLNHNC